MPRLLSGGPFIASATEGLVEEGLWVEDLPELDVAELRVVMYPADPTHDPAFECTTILNAHAFELHLLGEIDLEGLVIEVQRGP